MSLEEEEMEVEDEEAMEATEVGEQPIEGAMAEEDGVTAGNYSSKSVNEKTFEELHLGNDLALEVQVSWKAFLSAAESREAAGEAIYAALFDAAPSLQGLFKTPRAIMAMPCTIHRALKSWSRRWASSIWTWRSLLPA